MTTCTRLSAPGLIAIALAATLGADDVSSRKAADVPQAAAPVDNPAIDMEGHIRAVIAAAEHRARRRVDEDRFIRMSREPGTIVLDCRSRAKFDEVHVRGAVHLDFSDFTETSLKKTLPDKNARILIYCNNNFANAPKALESKAFVMALNLSTFAALYEYGYRNVYELGPQIDYATTKLELVGTSQDDAPAAKSKR